MSNHREAARIPLRHLSIRVPWHDNGWTGCVCEDPKANAACLVLDRIRTTRSDDDEAMVAGECIAQLEEAEWPACISERGTFMAPFEFTRSIRHPYSETSEEHAHILPTPFRQPPYSAAAIPFRWMNRKYAWDIAQEHNLDVDATREPDSPDWLKNSKWVQNHENQKALLEGFFAPIEPHKSLCFFYAKQTPLAEDDRRVIIGVGRVKGIDDLVEYSYAGGETGLRAYIWDRIVRHSIRPRFRDGFILPYQDIIEMCSDESDTDPSEFLAYAPDDRRIEFSYGAEHVTHDGAIGALLSCKGALERISKTTVKGPWERVLTWIDRRLSELWKLRGPYPGLGAALTAFGVEHGSFLAYELASRLRENEDPWPLVGKVFRDPSSLPQELARQISPTLRRVWKDLVQRKPARLALLKLLARMDLSADQAKRFYVQEERHGEGIECTDEELIANPYLVYEEDRVSPDPISVWTVDRGLFPAAVVRDAHPIPAPSAVDDPTDYRRVRAFIVNTLEAAANQGHTLMPRADVVRTIRELDLEPGCPVYGDLLEVIDQKLSPTICACTLADGTPAYQLKRLAEVGELIRRTVKKRLNGKRHALGVDWRQQLDADLGECDPRDSDEEHARIEKAAALEELADSRISVLVGSAGTGKTTLISVLCKYPSIRQAGVLLLTPTGKARVRLQQATGITAKTIAQFLLPLDRYNEATGAYTLSTSDKEEAGRTVVIDEASMLTEEQLAALLDALRGVERLILVGDPCQLPPIGAGRPFVDIVNYLRPKDIETSFPRVGKGYAELAICRRQIGEVREDLQLAEWFSGRSLRPGDDEIISRALSQDKLQHIRFVEWNGADDLWETLRQILIEELRLDSNDMETAFELTLGGSRDGNYVYFDRTSAGRAEAWQVLSPVRGNSCGVRDINRLMQAAFRKATVDFATSRYRRIPKPLGPDRIVYGDKVINVVNHRRDYVYPKEGALEYVANGEIGIVTGEFKSKSATWKGLPYRLNVVFSSQPDRIYTYYPREFNDEDSPLLELAYALTVHKAQGSEFDLCLLVLPNPCRLLSRELLYTALTRQRDRIVVLHQGNVIDLVRYSSARYSDTARRMTNLFAEPSPIELDGRVLDENLIHRSARGEPMRSKSEVIIADALLAANIRYHYEQPLEGSDGQVRYPDFTIEDAESGITYYWEHCGLLDDEQYRQRWERKLEWYRSQHILPAEEGRGENGVLIITRDEPGGAILADKIHTRVTWLREQLGQ